MPIGRRAKVALSAVATLAVVAAPIGLLVNARHVAEYERRAREIDRLSTAAPIRPASGSAVQVRDQAYSGGATAPPYVPPAQPYSGPLDPTDGQPAIWDCPSCLGAGRLVTYPWVSVACEFCNGRGSRLEPPPYPLTGYEEAPCVHCSGRGTRRIMEKQESACAACGGAGKVSWPHYEKLRG